jgi:hypothetical protein
MPVEPEPEHLDPHDADRGRALVAAVAAGTRAPASLRERLERDRARAGRPSRRGRRALLAPVGGLVAAVAAVILLAGGPGAPTVMATAVLAERGPQVAAPDPDAGNPAVLTEGVEGVRFPEWGRSLRWRSVGVRYDTIEGREATTVFYASAHGTRVAYTIVAGERLDPPARATPRSYGGTRMATFERDGRRVVTWERRGHTCILSAPTSVPEERLLALASWRGDRGRVAF